MALEIYLIYNETHFWTKKTIFFDWIKFFLSIKMQQATVYLGPVLTLKH